MSLQCAECACNIVDSKKASSAGNPLSFCVDGTSLHLVMGASNAGREGMGFRVVDVPFDKRPDEKNPYRSVAHVLCRNIRTDTGQECKKKVGGVKCYPPLSDNHLIFFTHKALLVDLVKHNSWKTARDSSLREVNLLPAAKEEEDRRFTPRRWPPLIRSHGAPSTAVASGLPFADHTGGGRRRRRQLGGGTGGRAGAQQQLTRTTPRGYQEELFLAVMGSERNSMVYLPTGLGKTLVACMVLRRLLDLNPGRQAYFLVETTALAVQQTIQLQNEIGGRVEMLVGSSLRVYGSGGGGGNGVGIGTGGESEAGVDHGRAKLERVRAADVVVATAGAFEHCMCKQYVDPDAICCVVLDEAHHCGKEHPFNRVATSFLTIQAFPNEAANPRRACELPKLVALTASPAGELTLYDTVVRIEQLLDRLGADLAAPVQHLQEVRRLTPSVQLELINVEATAPETAVLGCLERLVLSRVVRLAPEASEVRAQAQSLLARLDARLKDTTAAAAATAPDVPRKDDSWRFPNKVFAALCQRAVVVSASGGGGGSAEGVREREDGGDDGRGADSGVASGFKNGDGGKGNGSNNNNQEEEDTSDFDHPSRLQHLMNASFAMDEMGGRATWEKVLEELERGRPRRRPRPGPGPAPGGGDPDPDPDPELEEAIRVVKSYLPDFETSPSPSSPPATESWDGSSSEPEAAAGFTTTTTTTTTAAHYSNNNSGSTSTSISNSNTNNNTNRSESSIASVGGSKLAKIALLLEQHKRACDDSGKRFSALVFVSRRDLARQTPAMLEAALPGFVRAQAVVGLSEMTLNQQRAALAAFRDGSKNVLVSTSVCGEGIDVPACALVVCASLPSSGTELVQLRGRIRSKEEGCRFVGLTRAAGAADRAHLESICLRERNLLDAVRCLSLGRCSTLVADGIIIPAPTPATSGNSNSNSNSKAAPSCPPSFLAETTVSPPTPARPNTGFVKADEAAARGGRDVLAAGGGGCKASSKGSTPGTRVRGGGASGKTVSFDSVGGGIGNGKINDTHIPSSPTSDATAETYFSSETPSSLEALPIGSVPEGIAVAASAGGGGGGGGGRRRRRRGGSGLESEFLASRTALVSSGGGGGDGGGDGGGSHAFDIPPLLSSGAATAAELAELERGVETLTESTPAAATPPTTGSLVQREGDVGASSAGRWRRQAGPMAPGGGDVTAPAGSVKVAEKGPWKKELPMQLSPAARRYAATYLATCLRQALQRNPDQMARCTLNSAAQLAQTIKPVFAYDERKIRSSDVPNGLAFEARCIVSSLLKELSGLILVKEARGHSIKAAREGAAVKVKQYLLSKEVSHLQQPLASSS
eukprot:g18009.t1